MQSNEELQKLVNAIPIDPKTHPIILYEFEWGLFQKMQSSKHPLFHRHKWTYRGARVDGDVKILHQVESEKWPDGIEETALGNGRYCEDCRRVEFIDDTLAKKYTTEEGRWSQLDMIALGIR
jgi:hypothetical protein